MANSDTICLLKECDSGSKMAVSSINEILEKVKDMKLRKLLTESREHHEKLGNEIHALLNEYNSDPQEPTPIAKSMSWLKTNMKMKMDESDATAANLITDGCNMGIKSLYHYLNQYQTAASEAKELCKRLISIEEKLETALQGYL